MATDIAAAQTSAQTVPLTAMKTRVTYSIGPGGGYTLKLEERGAFSRNSGGDEASHLKVIRDGQSTRGSSVINQRKERTGPPSVVSYPAIASAFSHAIIAASVGTAFWRPGVSIRFWALGALFSVLPDVDVVGFGLGIQYGDLLGHRGLTHSLAFAAVMATIGSYLCAGRSASEPRIGMAWCYFFLATASHGLLDAMTDGGLGVAFFSPFSNARYFLPWRPIVVSPIGVAEFFSERGLNVLRSEFKWIWLPAALFAILAVAVRSRWMAPGGGNGAA